MRILAVDLAFRITGWVLLDGSVATDWGVIRIPKLPRGATLRDKAEREWQLWVEFMGQPIGVCDHVIYEFGSWPRSAGATHAMHAAVTLLNVATVHWGKSELHVVNPNEWQAGMLKGYPGTTKEASVARAQEETGIAFEHDVADAVCMGLWWLKHWEMNS